MNSRTAKRLLLSFLLCLQLGAGLPAPIAMAAMHGGAPTSAAPHCAHAMAHATNADSSHRTNHAGCCVEAGCSCACLVAAFESQPTQFAAAILQAIPLPLSVGALPGRIDSPLRPPI